MILDLCNPADVEIFQRGTDAAVVGITSGCFDLTHSHHMTYFLRCRRLCDILVVGVDSDDLVRKTKGENRPIVSENERVAMVNVMVPVQAAFVMGSVEDFRRAVIAFKAQKIFKNQDFIGREDEVVGIEEADELVIVPDISVLASTSQIIEEVIKKGIATGEAR